MYLNGLSVVCFYYVEVEAVDASPRSQEDTALLVKVASYIHQNLQKRRNSDPEPKHSL